MTAPVRGGRECRHCGSPLPDPATFCPGCGLARDAVLLDPLGVVAPPESPVDPPAPTPRRLVLVVGLGVLVGATGVAWALSAGGSDDPVADAADPGAGVAVLENLGDDTADPDRMVATPSDARSDGGSGDLGERRPATERADGWLVRDVEGPVLGEDVDGVLIVFLARTMHRVDLATGEVVSVDLDARLSSTGQDPPVVVGDDLISVTIEGSLVTTDLADGSQREVVDLGIPSTGILQVIGPAGPDSVWVTVRGTLEQTTVAFEIGLDGTTRQHVELPPAFQVLTSRGQDLYLSGPDGSLRYDTTSRTAEGLAGQITTVDAGVVVLVACEPTLECHVEVDTGGGFVRVPHLSTDELLFGAVQAVTRVAPDLAGAIVPGYDPAEVVPLLTHIALDTGERTEIRGARMAEHGAFAWLTGHPWVVGFDEDGYDLVAVNTGTAESLLLDLPGGLGPSGGSHIVWQPSG